VKPAVERRIRELRAKGMGMIRIGKALGVGTATVQRVVAAAKTGSRAELFRIIGGLGFGAQFHFRAPTPILT
jgi:hypothetical protein